MTGLGWIFMLASVGAVSTLVFWCFHRVLSAPREPPDEGQRFGSA